MIISDRSQLHKSYPCNKRGCNGTLVDSENGADYRCAVCGFIEFLGDMIEYHNYLFKGVINTIMYTSDKRVLLRATSGMFGSISNNLPCNSCGKTGYQAVNWENNACSLCKEDQICFVCASVNNFNKAGRCMSDECRTRRNNQ